MKYLIIGPGGQGLFKMLGYLKKIEDKLKDVEEISGASAGAIIGLFLALGKTPSEILDFSINVDVEAHTKFNLKSLLKNFGFIEHDMLRNTIIEKAGGNFKFKELKKKLYVSSMCVNTSSTVYFSRDTHPDMYVVDAICASISIPIMFSAFRYQNGLYLDGGTLEEIPAVPFLHKNGDEVFAIQLKLTPPVFKEITDIKSYLKNIIVAGFLTRLSYPQIRRVYLVCDGIDILDWKLTVEDKLRLFISGQS